MPGVSTREWYESFDFLELFELSDDFDVDSDYQLDARVIHISFDLTRKHVCLF